MATWHQQQNKAAIAAIHKPKPHVWRVVVNNSLALMYAQEYSNERDAKRFLKVKQRKGETAYIINPPEMTPFLIRRKYYPDSKQWELFAVFPTIPALSSSWYEMEALAENGDTFACNHDFYRSSRNIRGHDPKAVAAFEARVRDIWEKDDDCPLSLIRYERVPNYCSDKRKAAWQKGRI